MEKEVNNVNSIVLRNKNDLLHNSNLYTKTGVHSKPLYAIKCDDVITCQDGDDECNCNITKENQYVNKLNIRYTLFKLIYNTF